MHEEITSDCNIAQLQYLFNAYEAIFFLYFDLNLFLLISIFFFPNE